VAPLQFQIVEIADGGDGSLEVLKNRIPGAKTADVTVHDPLGREVVSQILLYSLPGAEKDTFFGAEKRNVAACAGNGAETRPEGCGNGFCAGNGAETRAEGCGNGFCAGNGAEMRSEGGVNGFCAGNVTETRPEGCVNEFCAGNGPEMRAEGGELCAFIEMAKVSGLEMLAKGERNPLLTSTYGMGEAIKAAVANGATQVTLSIGGSATNDGGAGMLQALGYRFLDAQGGEIAVPICGGDLQRVAEIVAPCTDAGDVGNIVDACNVVNAGEGVMCGAGKGASGNCAGGKGRSVLSGVKFKVICDVSNPLLGPQGATAVYGPQKGADAQALVCLEAGLANFAAVAERCLGVAPEMKVYPGAGAAGGVGYAGTAFLGGNLVSGWKFFTEITSLEEKVQWADLVITGEGSVDSQSLSGKIVGGVMELARKWNRPVEIFCGISSLQELPQGVRCHSLASIEPDLQVCMTQAAALLEKLAWSVEW
jgi:glycerate kinase